MRIGTSRADRIGFFVFVALASVLAALLLTNLNNGTTESVQEVSNFADLAPAEAAEPVVVPTTEAVAMPEPTPTAVPVEPVAAAAAALPDVAGDADDDAASDDEALTDDAVEADDASVEAETAQAASSESQGSTTAATANEAPPATEDPNPQPAATEVPNPQPATTPVPNPQPAATAVPNPQAPTTPVTAPAAAPQGGTFTHTLTAVVSQPSLHTSAGGPTFMPTFNGTALPPVNPTVFGNPLVYRVLAGSPDDPSGWAQVYVPARPNGTTAWVQTSQFRWGSSNRMLQINVSNNTVTVFEGGNAILSTEAVTGKSSSRTPLANGWVEEIMAGPSSAYGPRLISLGMFSDDLNSFGGSVPKIALHGTNNPSLMGQYASNGCIRVRNEVINQIASMLPVGSKVQIVG